MSSTTTIAPMTVATVTLPSGHKIFYRASGPATGRPVLLVHGFPSSSHQFRHLLPILGAQGYRALAPDLPGYGFSVLPPRAEGADTEYKHTFANFALALGEFCDALDVKEAAAYIFDYGAPTVLRLALARPGLVKAVVSQNGNAYMEGLGKDFWAPLDKFWQSTAGPGKAGGNPADREALRGLLELEATRWQYETGVTDEGRKAALQPEAWHLDQMLMDRPGNKDVQLDLLYDYRTNLPLYPKFQAWLRESGVPVLAAWGKNDQIFVPEGAEAYKRDAKVAEVHLLDAGHFVLESHLDEMVALIVPFLGKQYPA